METRPRSVLAAFQEHLQLASTKCGSLMEQLNIVRKKVEGKEAMAINGFDQVSDDFLKNVSPKTVLQSEEINPVDHKDVLNKEQMAVGNAYVEQSTEDKNCDFGEHLMIRKSSQHSEIVVNKEEVPILNGKVTSDEKECYSLQFDGAPIHKRSGEKLIKETEQISGKASLSAIAGSEKESFDEDLSSDDDSTLSSCSSSTDDGQEASDNENIYEELLKRLKDNEEKKNINNNRSSSENSSSTFKKSQKTDKSPKKKSSSSTVIEDGFDKKNGYIENLDVGVDFFLPSSVTEKFQEMYDEVSGEEDTLPQNISNKDKNMRVTFDDLIVGRPKKHSFRGETLSEDITSQNLLLDETSLKTKIGQISHNTQNDKVKEKSYEASSVKTKSEKGKKTNTAVCGSAVLNLKLHSPEMNLYKRLTGVPVKPEIKKLNGRKDIKSKKTANTTSRLKGKHIITEQKSKTLPNKKNTMDYDNSKNNKKEIKPPKTIINTDKDVVKEVIIKNKSGQKTITVNTSKNLHKNSDIEIVPTDSQQKKVDEVKFSSGANLKKVSSDEIFNHKEELKYDNAVNLVSKNMILKKNLVHKVDNQVKVKEKLESNKKSLISKKNHVIRADDQNILKKNHVITSDNQSIQKKNHIIPADDKDISKEKLPKGGKSAVVKETKPAYSKKEHHSKNNMRTLTAGKELSSKHSCINDEISAINTKLKNSKNRVRPNTTAQLPQPKMESNKAKLLSVRKEETFEMRNLQSLDNRSSKTREPSESLKGKNHSAKDTIHSQSVNEMKTHTASFPFILGQSTSKTYNVRAAIQQTMSMIMSSPAETLRRSSFSEMLNVSSKASTVKTSASCTSGRKVCPACVMRVDEEDNEPDEKPIDPWDTEYHSKRFIRCTCMPRNTVNFKTVMNQLLHETSSSYILPTESYQDSELENGQENRVNKSLFRKNNNIDKLSKLLHTLLKIRDLLVT